MHLLQEYTRKEGDINRLYIKFRLGVAELGSERI